MEAGGPHPIRDRGRGSEPSSPTCSGMAAKPPLGGPPRELTLIGEGLGHPRPELGGRMLGSPRKWAVGGPRSRASAPSSTEKA